MMRRVPLSALMVASVPLVLALPGLAQGTGGDAGADPAPVSVPVAVPSGQAVAWLDTITGAPGPDGLVLRFRFVAPEIADATRIPPDVALADMAALCDSYALPRVASLGPRPEQIIISLSDRALSFGDPAPEAVQYFEAFSLDGEHCEVEVF